MISLECLMLALFRLIFSGLEKINSASEMVLEMVATGLRVSLTFAA